MKNSHSTLKASELFDLIRWREDHRGDCNMKTAEEVIELFRTATSNKPQKPVIEPGCCPGEQYRSQKH